MVCHWILDTRQHDFRLELDCHEIIPTCDPEFIVIKKFVESISQTPGTLTFTPCDGWKVNMFRYKRQSTFLYQDPDPDPDPDTFMVTMSDVKECRVAWENYGRRNEGEQLTVNLEDLASHWELEVNSMGDHSVGTRVDPGFQEGGSSNNFHYWAGSVPLVTGWGLG